MYDIYDFDWDIEIDLVYENEEDLIIFALQLLDENFVIQCL